MSTKNIETKFVEKLKGILMSDNYQNINVLQLCKTLGVKRQTFYYHYNDIGDLIIMMLLSQEIEGLENCESHYNVSSCLIKFLKNNETMIARLLEVNADSSLEYFFYEVFYKSLTKIFKNKYEKSLKIKDINGMNFLLSSYLSKLLIYFLSSHKSFETIEFENYINIMSLGIEEKIFSNLTNIKS